MRRFFLYNRSGIWYVRLIDQTTGNRLSGLSTHAADRNEAFIIADRWITEGIPQYAAAPRTTHTVFTLAEVTAALQTLPLTTADSRRVANILKKRGLLVSFVFPDELGIEPFAEFLVRFWTYDKSPYVKDKHAHGYRMGRTHCEQSLGRAQKYWVPFFAKKRLSEITKAVLKAFALYLGDDKLGLSPVTRNRVLTVGTTALRWVYANEYIREDVTAGVATFSEKLRKRGVLSPSEVKKLFALEWPDDRIKLGNLVAATTGLRVGEVISLKPENVSAKSLYIENSFSEIDGLKCTKTDEVRRVPLSPRMNSQNRVARRNPKAPSNGHFYVLPTNRTRV